jgi:hypothetical protein
MQRLGRQVRMSRQRSSAPTVILPTSRVPAMDAFTTGMCSDSSDSKTLQHSREALSITDISAQHEGLRVRTRLAAKRHADIQQWPSHL